MSLLRHAVRRHWLVAAVLLVAVAAVVLQGGSVPHTHAGIGPGVYNHDHDGTLLATLHGAATISAAQPAMLLFAMVSSVAPTATDPVDSAPRPTADSRAPPLA